MEEPNRFACALVIGAFGAFSTMIDVTIGTMLVAAFGGIQAIGITAVFILIAGAAVLMGATGGLLAAAIMSVVGCGGRT